MSCENKKNVLFSFKIVCENNLKRASDCFSDTLEIQIFQGETPVPPPPQREGANSLSYSPPAHAFGTQICDNGMNIAEPPISGLVPSTSNRKWQTCTLKLFMYLHSLHRS